MNTVTANGQTIEIKGALYAVEVIPAGECGQSAVRLGKLSSGEAYDVIRENDGSVSCDCPDFEMRRKGTGVMCKHGVACVAHNLLPMASAPVAKPAPTPAPVTDLDRKRAQAFGIKLPKIDTAPALVAPAPVVEVAPCFEVETAPVVIEAPRSGFDEVLDFIATLPIPAKTAPATETDTGESWETWDDSLDFPWTITETVPADDDQAEASVETASAPTDPWMAETTALYLTGQAVEMIEEGFDNSIDMSEWIDGLWVNLEAENKTAFLDFLRQINSPASGWTSWLALVVQGSPVSFPEPIVAKAKPTRLPRFVPSPEDEAEVLGFELGLAGIDASAPSGWNSHQRSAFFRGLADGMEALHAETQDFEAWLDSIAPCEADPLETWHDAEIDRCGGRRLTLALGA